MTEPFYHIFNGGRRKADEQHDHRFTICTDAIQLTADTDQKIVISFTFVFYSRRKAEF